MTHVVLKTFSIQRYIYVVIEKIPLNGSAFYRTTKITKVEQGNLDILSS